MIRKNTVQAIMMMVKSHPKFVTTQDCRLLPVAARFSAATTAQIRILSVAARVAVNTGLLVLNCARVSFEKPPRTPN